MDLVVALLCVLSEYWQFNMAARWFLGLFVCSAVTPPDQSQLRFKRTKLWHKHADHDKCQSVCQVLYKNIYTFDTTHRDICMNTNRFLGYSGHNENAERMKIGSAIFSISSYIV